MRKAALILLCAVCAVSLRAQAPSDGANAVLDSLAVNYLVAIQGESVETKQGECDFLIGTIRDSLLRRHLAVTLFNYYKDAPVMGDEAVAIHLYDKWFAPGLLHFAGEFEGLEAEMFCNMNRNTLLGMDAPVLKARRPCGGSVSVPAKGVTTLLWFYDTACSKCRLEAKVLPAVLEKSVDFPITLVAFCAGRDRKAWKEFRRSFKVDNRNVRLVHCWDPGVDSDYLRLYGVVSTPKMYMVAPEGSIIGRRLEVDALQQLLPTAKSIHNIFTGGNRPSDPIRGFAAHPSQAGAWAPPSNIAEGGMPPGGPVSSGSSN